MDGGRRRIKRHCGHHQFLEWINATSSAPSCRLVPAKLLGVDSVNSRTSRIKWGLAGVSVPSGKTRTAHPSGAKLGQHRVKPGDAEQFVRGQSKLAMKRTDEVSLAPPDLLGQVTDAEHSLPGNDAVPCPLDAGIEIGLVVLAPQQCRVEYLSTGDPDTFPL